MSPREQAQIRILQWLIDHQDKFNAPYGIIDSLQNVGKGKVRTITFGQSRWLDCTVSIWSPNRITVDAQGPASRNIDNLYRSVDELLVALEKM